MKKIFQIAFTGIALTFILLTVSPVFAAVRCEMQYGGRENCVRTGQLQIDKKVFDPKNKKFVDNLGINDYHFSPGEETTFKLKVKNIGDETFNQINVVDTLPSFLASSGSSLFFKIKDLKAGETRELEVKARVISANNFPTSKNLICVINTAEAAAGNEKDRDTAQLCLERKVLGKGFPTVLPPTGPENWLAILGGSLLSLIAGAYLIKLGKIH